MTERCKFVKIQKNKPLGKRRRSRLVDARPTLGHGNQSSLVTAGIVAPSVEIANISQMAPVLQLGIRHVSICPRCSKGDDNEFYLLYECEANKEKIQINLENIMRTENIDKEELQSVAQIIQETLN